MKMCKSLLALAATLASPGTASAQSLPLGAWEVTSTPVKLIVPGTPGFLLRMMRGKFKTERKCLLPDRAKAGVATLLTPKPESKCTVERSMIADGRIEQIMACSQKKGAPVRVVNVGSYAATSFSLRMTMKGQTEKGAMRIVANQVARWTGADCRK